MYLSSNWYRLSPNFDVEHSSITERLDVSVLQNKILAPLLGIENPRTDKRIGFVGGIRGIETLEQLVESGSAAAAFALHPVSIEEPMEISDAGLIMPPKSTWFEPKLCDGLITHCF